MEDGFLFDDEDPKEIGVGCDALCAGDKRLKWKWTWGTFNKGEPCQCSEAELEDGWMLETLFWHSKYEARVTHLSDTLVRYKIDSKEDKIWNPEKLPALLTRLDAQLKAEELFEELAKDMIKQLNRILLKGASHG